VNNISKLSAYQKAARSCSQSDAKNKKMSLYIGINIKTSPAHCYRFDMNTPCNNKTFRVNVQNFGKANSVIILTVFVF
jgi:hypothetical protein